MRDPITIPADDPSRAGEVRRAAVALAARLGFDEVDQGRVALVATEVATNLIKHATGGEVILRSLTVAEGGGLEVLALDRGPGMADIGQCLRDGFSTSGTAGSGLGAIRRLSDLFEVYSLPKSGTALVARLRDRAAGHALSAHNPLSGAVCLTLVGEDVCGDAWAIESYPARTALLLADGLGHGLSAATAAREAVRVFRANAQLTPGAILDALHAALRPTRGAAGAVAVIDHTTRTLQFAGVGNIAGAIIGPTGRQGLVSLAGTLGHEVRKVRAFEYAWPPGAILVMHSDGLGSQWDVSRYPGLAARHPALVAAFLYRDYRRVRDDVTVVVIRDPGGDPS